ncbi:hypothetical protein FPQ18DRAFT_394384 [Pyronema domesticum]|uniref:Similar to Transcriptional regulator CRZ1 acc. no. P53968 n=1 Tax=Pyronema omphalodes (strain CBS 100304) TaxID=1076935 RepID=U4L498_PYROM|nr:hypothetical protein FPQ18DRAFT_394384 [Pyronema domesticum]CCX04880.1 Similar to Transcriptional regulator CRZ1; acc. no. P53968 [Pyronema omphalodes CBS 100304]
MPRRLPGKIFQYRGNFKAGGTWGCGKIFGRKYALNRHVRSDAGRVCFRPLLDGETAEREPQQRQHTAFPNVIIKKYPALANIAWDTASPEGDYDDNSALEMLENKFKDDLSDAGGIAGGSSGNSFDGGRPGGDRVYDGENRQQGSQQQGAGIGGTVEGEGDTSVTGEAGEDEDGGVDSVPNIFALGNRRIQKDEVGFGGTVEEEGDTSATGVTGADGDEIIASIIKPFGSFGYREQRDEV